MIIIIITISQGGKCEKYSRLQEETFPGVMKVGKDLKDHSYDTDYRVTMEMYNVGCLTSKWGGFISV